MAGLGWRAESVQISAQLQSEFCEAMAPKRPRVEVAESDAEHDFSQWAMQDLAKAPLPSASRDVPAPVMWLGVQSLAEIGSGCDGKVLVNNASKRGVTFSMGYVEGFRKETHVVLPNDAPRVVANLFSVDVAKKVLNNASFRRKLEEAGCANLALGVMIDRILQELDVYTPEELESLKAFCELRGDDEMRLRGGRDGGELFMAVIDVVMVAKKCTYDAARVLCQRLFRDYQNTDLDLNENAEERPQFFQTLRLQKGRCGGQPTLCVAASHLSEFMSVINGMKIKPHKLILDDLYMMQYSFDSTTIKIGRSVDVERRRRGLEASHNFRLIVIRTFPRKGYLEKKIHRRLKQFRCIEGLGREWFRLSSGAGVKYVSSYFLRMRLWRGCNKLISGPD